MKKRLVILLTLVLMLTTTTIVYAQFPGGNGGYGNNSGEEFPFMRLKNLLNEEQMQELKDLVRDMHQNGASKEEIHEAVMELLGSWGIEIPEDFNGHRNLLPKILWRQLTEEQKEILKNTISSMREDGASREEIKEAVDGLLEEWGIDLSVVKKHMWRRILHHKLMEQLTEDQQEELKALIKEMHETGASHAEIHAEIVTLLESWGIDIPDDWGQRRHRRLPKEIMDQLTNDQIDELKALIQGMHENNATRKEIHEAVTDLLVSWGIDLPVNWDDGPRNHEENETGKLNESKNLFGVSNHPNPFNPDTHISYSLQNTANVNVKIYDMAGNHIRTLANTSQEAGSYTLYWDGLDDKGLHLPSGIYLVKIDAGSETITHNMILMK